MNASSNGHKVVSPAALKAARRETHLVSCPSSNVYRVKRIENHDLVSLLGGFPAVADIPTNAKEAARAEKSMAAQMARNPGMLLARTEAMVAAGLVEPKLGEGEDEIVISDIPYADLQYLANAIMELSGFNVAAAEKLRPFSQDATS